MQNKTIIGCLLLAVCSATGCAAPYDSSGGSQVGSLWGAHGNVVRVNVWGADLQRMGSDVVILFDGDPLKAMHCESSGFCGVVFARYGTYDITVTVSAQSQNKTVVLDEQDIVQIDPGDCELGDCEPWAEEFVEFFFTE